ncbi:FAD/NAD(P)-binding domain-containing protein [Coprinopsis marcescibilis]|uniref:FAD/NAD(P)-binding domain-containing protein n=1 Tax=Coprinopsis marcescibilis TaxID=230819 RepID=A0A5C3KMW1_COPMA|nr:FAD/NAD(P)-binding domain-containing protein [Coprinopsis marcescibilis]
MSDGRKNVVVVGGGPAGTMICRQLSKKLDRQRFNLILVTERPYYTHLPASIRMVVSSEGNLEETIHMPYDNLFRNGKNGKVIIARATRVEEDEANEGGVVFLNTGEEIEYTLLVVATGCTWEGPLDLPGAKDEEKKWVDEWREKFAAAEDVVIVGGGSVGIEFAGEIRDLESSKRITIVHDQDLLLNDAYSAKFRNLAMNNIHKRGVEVILGDAIPDLEISPANTIRTAKGRLLVADLVIPCRGPRPNTDFLNDLTDHPLTQAGHVRVTPTLQVFRHPRILAAGDIIEWDDQKQMIKYPAHAGVITHTVLDVLNGRDPNHFYKGSYERIVISNGRKGGVSYYTYWGPRVQFGDQVSSKVAKGKVLKKGFARQALGL